MFADVLQFTDEVMMQMGALRRAAAAGEALTCTVAAMLGGQPLPEDLVLHLAVPMGEGEPYVVSLKLSEFNPELRPTLLAIVSYMHDVHNASLHQQTELCVRQVFDQCQTCLQVPNAAEDERPEAAGLQPGAGPDAAEAFEG